MFLLGIYALSGFLHIGVSPPHGGDIHARVEFVVRCGSIQTRASATSVGAPPKGWSCFARLEPFSGYHGIGAPLSISRGWWHGQPYTFASAPLEIVIIPLMVMAARRIRRLFTRPAWRCACGYDLRLLLAPRCPECGRPIRGNTPIAEPP